MLFLEGAVVNIVVIVLCMYLDRYVLGSFCKEHPFLDAFFKLWLVATFISVAYVLLQTVTQLGVFT